METSAIGRWHKLLNGSSVTAGKHANGFTGVQNH
jgi:hypothetical protein